MTSSEGLGENGVILDKIFIFQLFLFVFLFYEIFFTCIVKYPLVYLPYFLFIFPFENKGVVTVFTKSNFVPSRKNVGSNWKGYVWDWTVLVKGTMINDKNFKKIFSNSPSIL